MEEKLYKLIIEGNKISFVDAGKIEMDNKSRGDVVVMMEKEVYKAAVNGNKSVLTNSAYDLVKSRNPQKNNIIHIAARHERYEFLEEAVKRFPQLVGETNCQGDNPLHVAAITGNLPIVDLLVTSFKNCAAEINKEISKPWLEHNEEGNTPLHLALMYGKIKVATYLLKIDGDDDPQLARTRNNLNQTPLHLAVHYHVDDDLEAVQTACQIVIDRSTYGGRNFYTKNKVGNNFCCGEKDSKSLIELLLKKERTVACWRDKEGMTPLLTAATLDPPYLPAIHSILEHCPESTEVCDASGRTLLHLLTNIQLPNRLEYYGNLLKSSSEVKVLRFNRDNTGDTPIHLALQDNEYIDMFLASLKYPVNFAIRNKDRISIADLIQQEYDSIEFPSSRHDYTFIIGDEDEGHKVTKETTEITSITHLREQIGRFGNSLVLKNYGRRKNILHVAIEKWESSNEIEELSKCIQECLDICPSLIFQKGEDCHDTPLHAIVMKAPEVLNKAFLNKVQYYFEKIDATTIEVLSYDSAWKAKDVRGNTPLHNLLRRFDDDENITAERMRCVEELVGFDSGLVLQVNANGQTPLHVLSENVELCRYLKEKDKSEVMESIIEKNQVAVELKDNNGLTPLLSAAKKGNLYFIIDLIEWGNIDDVTKQLDDEGNTYQHLLAGIVFSKYPQTCILALKELYDDYYFSIRDSKNYEGNIPLHLIIEKANYEFGMLVDKTKCTYSLHERNENGKTPIHLMVGESDKPLAQDFINHVLERTSDLRHIGKYDHDGNTVLHEAIIRKDFDLVKMITNRLLILINDDDDDDDDYDDDDDDDDDKEILEKSNKDDNSLWHLAIEVDQFQMAQDFSEVFLKVKHHETLDCILQKRNKDGKTPFHLAFGRSHKTNAMDFISHGLEKSVHLKNVLGVKDNKGYTPLHQAILNKDFKLVKIIIQTAMMQGQLNDIMDICDEKGESFASLIGYANLPDEEFEKFIWNEPKVVQEMIGVRSLSGVSTEIIKDYTNTIGVTAALLATITFTAAFTVPGGSDDKDGTPILMKEAAFQVFMVSDVLAMCLSMMVLFCLLWIMTIGNKKNQVVLLDITILLLQGAFYATLLTFMTGLYVTVSPMESWIAISTCVVCSLLILLMHKKIILKIIPFFVRIYVEFKEAYSIMKRLCGSIFCSTGCIQNKYYIIREHLKQAYSLIKSSCGHIFCCSIKNDQDNEQGNKNCDQAI